MDADGWLRTAVLGSVALVLFGMVYAVAILSLSRREPRARGRRAGRAFLPAQLPVFEPSDPIFVVFVAPCLNEATVIGASIERMLGFDHPDMAILVVDDGSDDGTGDIVESFADPRVSVLRRVLPDARKGKGEALNAAVAHLVGSRLLAGRDPRRVVVAVVDADGRVEPWALTHVLPCFEDPMVGGVQIGVRINNRHVSRLARMQDMEFVVYTEVFQRGRRHLGSVGLGGNGQFMRLAALMSLGPAPWSRSLTEDLDLGVRLLALGWRNEFCSAVAVHQQGVVEVGRLVRQRTRWFQGHLQSWALVPTVVTRLGGTARLDLYHHLTSPVLTLLGSLMTLAFVIGLAGTVLEWVVGGQAPSWWLLSSYALAVGPAIAFGLVYRVHDHRTALGRAMRAGMSRAQARSEHVPIPVHRVVGFAHLYVAYALIWFVAGWSAVWRTLRGQTGWAKTDRTAETAESTLDDAAGAGPASGAGSGAGAGAGAAAEAGS